MKIVVQNGCEHVLTRSSLEHLIKEVPPKYLRAIRQITLFQSSDERMYAQFFKKDKVLGLFCPKNWPGSSSEAVDELLVAIASIHDSGDYHNLRKTLRQEYLEEMRR